MCAPRVRFVYDGNVHLWHRARQAEGRCQDVGARGAEGAAEVMQRREDADAEEHPPEIDDVDAPTQFAPKYVALKLTFVEPPTRVVMRGARGSAPCDAS